MKQIEQRLEEVAKLIQSDQDAIALRLHVEQLLGSPAFSSSRRSGQFLQYVVEKSLAQETDALKERTIGIEIFHRPPNYDTGEDAVVRVTASDVRRRLAQHYSREGLGSDFRISLPPGGYVPEIFRSSPIDWIAPEISPDQGQTASVPAVPPAANLEGTVADAGERNARSRGYAWLAVAGIALILFTAGAIGWTRHSSKERVDATPWPLLFSTSKPLYLLLSDPDLNEIQLLTGKSVTLSDYANGRLGCESLPPALRGVCASSLRGDKVAAVDAIAISRLTTLAAGFHASIEPHPAREIRLTDLQGDRNVVFLGSRRANPWTDLFREKTDLYVGHDDASGLQVIHNTRPRPGEAPLYMPTAGPSGTGENYALITFTRNLSGQGYALLLTGATHEGTDEAVAMVTDTQRFAAALTKCNLPSKTTGFQLLLKLKMMAGTALTSDVVTCHVL